MADMEDSKDSEAVSDLKKEEETEQLIAEEKEKLVKVTNDEYVDTEKDVEKESKVIDEKDLGKKEVHDEEDMVKGNLADEEDQSKGKEADEEDPGKGKVAEDEDMGERKVDDNEDRDPKLIHDENPNEGETGIPETGEDTQKYEAIVAGGFLFNVNIHDEYEVQENMASLLPKRGTIYFAPMKRSYKAVMLTVDENSDPVRKNETIDIDYSTLTARFETMDLTIEASKVRFATLFKRTSTHTTQYEINLSLALDSYTAYHVLGDTLRDTVDIGNGFRRLIYESFKRSSATDEEAKFLMDYMPPKFSGEISVYVTEIEETSDHSQIPEKYHCVLDKECLSLFKSNLDTLPVMKLCFWHETHEDSVDKVMLFHDKELLRIQSLTKRFDVLDISTSYAELLRAMRYVQPLPKESYKGQKGILERHRFLVEEEKKRLEDFTFREGYPPMPRRPHPRMDPRGAFPPGLEDDKMAEASTLQTFYDELNRAEQQYQTAEELSLQWIVAEEEIKSILDQGCVPETDVLSGGLDPDNVDHFLKCVEEIENRLKQQEYQLALSRLQGTKKLFWESQISEMSLVLSIEDIPLLKKMYYHSFA